MKQEKIVHLYRKVLIFMFVSPCKKLCWQFVHITPRTTTTTTSTTRPTKHNNREWTVCKSVVVEKCLEVVPRPNKWRKFQVHRRIRMTYLLYRSCWLPKPYAVCTFSYNISRSFLAQKWLVLLNWLGYTFPYTVLSFFRCFLTFVLKFGLLRTLFTALMTTLFVLLPFCTHLSPLNTI